MRRPLALGLLAAAGLAGIAACRSGTPPPAKAAAPGRVEAPVETPSAAAPAAPLPVEPAAVPSGERPPAGDPVPAPAPATPPSPSADLETAPPLPVTLRIGLASDLERVELPCCSGELAVEAEGRPIAVLSPLVVTPAAEIARRAVYRLQVAALRDEEQAAGLARRFGERTGLPADAHFDAGDGLYRVRVGRFAERGAADAARRRWAGQGTAEAWVVSEGGEIGEASLRLTRGRETTVVPGRWLALARTDGGTGIAFDGKRYRGRLLLYLNDRGTLNVINEVDLEDYLRGVVPAEMGPAVYPRLEALKAQAVAARTYALRTRGEFDREGFDLCATPRCQVYKGIDVEHTLSDRAIAETAGQVLLWRGELVDARFSSTCGGHTEDVAIVFPLESYPYLKGVPCVEAGVDRISGSTLAGGPFPGVLTRALFPPPPAASPEAALGARLVELARVAGLPVPDDRLASLERRELQRFVASLFDLALDARLFVAAEDLPYLLESPPADWTAEDLRRAAYLAKSGLLDGPLDRALAPAEGERLLLRLAQLLRRVEVIEGAFRGLDGRRLTLAVDAEERTFDLPAEVATFRRRGEERTGGELALVPGDRVAVYLSDGRAAAVVQEVDLDGVAYDRTSSWASWSRFRSDAQLARLVEERYPGLGFSGFDVLTRGVSGRVGKIRLRGRNGAAQEVEGLAVRWTLDLPDTRFTAKRLQPKRGEAGYLFTGSGWGHGVGMCQVGSYGMAGRGHGYRRILEHYYTGVTLARIKPPGPRGAAVW